MLIRHTARHYFAEQLQADDDLEVLTPALLRAAASAVAAQRERACRRLCSWCSQHR